MKDDATVESARPPAALSTGPHAGAGRSTAAAQSAQKTSGHPVFWVVWHGCTALLVFSILLVTYSAGRAYSTRRYLHGFSAAIVPADFTPSEKVQSILNWMAGPAAQDTSRSTVPVGHDRNPVDTLNYASLLDVCGTATNAFINLADTAGLSARRLLLLNAHWMTKHVVAEVFINGRWIVVDPLYRFIARGPGGTLLTRKELADPAIFYAATRNIPNYDPAYNYQRTAYVHFEKVPYVGHYLRTLLNELAPGWNSSPMLSLFLERESLIALVLSITLLLLVVLLRASLHWYGEARLGIKVVSVRKRILYACHALVDASSRTNSEF